ncbi:MAG: OmpP1/FadL family transporter, partial [Limisphaerales bacterium]
MKTIASRLKVTKPFGFALTVSTLLLPAHIFALGIRLPDQDAFATARGNAFVATADNPSAIYYNPAGITQLDGINSRSGIYGIYMNDHFENGANSVNTKQKLQAVPQLYMTAKLPTDVPLSLGLGVYSPYGLGLEWNDNAPFLNNPASAFNVPKKGHLMYITVNPVIAVKPFKTLSIAAGPSWNHAESELEFQPFGVDHARFRGRDDDWGYNIGALWQPCCEHSFGVTYRSETTFDLTGHSDTHLAPGFPYPFPVNISGRDAHTPFKFPQTIVAGYSFRPNTNWNFEFNADWTDWHRLKSLTLSDANTGAQLQSLPLDWQSSWMFEFGATRYLENNWHISGGYIYSMNSTPDEHFNPVVPDSDRH